MKKYTSILAFLLPFVVEGADHSFSGTRAKRHREMREHYASQKKEKSGWFGSSSKEYSKEKPWFQRKYMTGNWSHARSKIAEHGWTISSTYTTDIQWNVDGGVERGYGSCGSFGLDIQVDFDKFAHIPGLEFNVGFITRSGVNLSARKVGNDFAVGQIYGSETYLLDVMYFQQTAFDGRFVFKAGRLNGGDDFLQSESYYKYANNAFCGNPVGVFRNTPFSAYPNSTWGAYFHVLPSKETKWKFAVYSGNTERTQNKFHGTDFRFQSDTGALGITEISWELGQKPNDFWYPATYKWGTYGVSQKKTKFTEGSGYNWGTYIQLDQMLYMPDKSDKKRGLTAFGAFLFAPQDRNEFPFFFTSGLTYQGIFKSRAEDSLSLGFARGGYSASMRQIQKDAQDFGLPSAYGAVPQHFEAVIEANYWIYINPWWYVAPDYQYIINPSGFGTIKNAHVVGAQTGVTF